ncbi:MAG: type IX secretion system membrane protein PorP/SprF [Bacteroidales bacterium]|nr:type IX secretion system membrane protein PorP/SprF [Bacteroidales bacterium]
MKRIAAPLLLAYMFVISAKASQDPLYTQFMTNPYLINPALTGTSNYYQIMANNRIQWMGFADAPITNTISMYGPMVKQPMGIGGYIMQDKFGPESKFSINGTYAYNYAITEDMKISMGLMLGFFQHKIDGGMLTIKEKNDRYFGEGQIFQNYRPDASVGAYLYSGFYHVGLSVTNLFGNKVYFENDQYIAAEEDTTDRSTLSRLKQHYYVHGGYKYFFNREWAIEPTLIVRKVSATPLQLDFNVRTWYGKRSWEGNKIWGGVSYRTGDAVNILIGYSYQRKIEVGYSYDIGISKNRYHHSGSHEIMISFKFNDIKEY